MVSLAMAVGAMASACAHPTQFDRDLAREDWVQAARAFSSDTSLRNNEQALYRAAVLYGTPSRPTYQPDTARALLSRLLTRFPATMHREDALTRLSLLDQLVTTQRAAEVREHELEARIEVLVRQARELRGRADSTSSQSDSLRLAITRLEAERKERDDQIKALRLELQQLKEIDLKPRPPTRPIKPE